MSRTWVLHQWWTYVLYYLWVSIYYPRVNLICRHLRRFYTDGLMLPLLCSKIARWSKYMLCISIHLQDVCIMAKLSNLDIFIILRHVSGQILVLSKQHGIFCIILCRLLLKWKTLVGSNPTLVHSAAKIISWVKYLVEVRRHKLLNHYVGDGRGFKWR